eukprot:TRINITY_DN16678_c0_g1_i1.p1 TRINITY_DN16678_c0_g1~~TRINITY_DN16678_c0_g1_i1.p1  ORF type:complete len:789 (+),score=136.44 TRINITY_DN16678_c0_g1_i1:453-2819(+)
MEVCVCVCMCMCVRSVKYAPKQHRGLSVREGVGSPTKQKIESEPQWRHSTADADAFFRTLRRVSAAHTGPVRPFCQPVAPSAVVGAPLVQLEEQEMSAGQSEREQIHENAKLYPSVVPVATGERSPQRMRTVHVDAPPEFTCDEDVGCVDVAGAWTEHDEFEVLPEVPPPDSGEISMTSVCGSVAQLTAHSSGLVVCVDGATCSLPATHVVVDGEGYLSLPGIWARRRLQVPVHGRRMLLARLRALCASVGVQCSIPGRIRRSATRHVPMTAASVRTSQGELELLRRRVSQLSAHNAMLEKRLTAIGDDYEREMDGQRRVLERVCDRSEAVVSQQGLQVVEVQNRCVEYATQLCDAERVIERQGLESANASERMLVAENKVVELEQALSVSEFQLSQALSRESDLQRKLREETARCDVLRSMRISEQMQAWKNDEERRENETEDNKLHKERKAHWRRQLDREETLREVRREFALLVQRQEADECEVREQEYAARVVLELEFCQTLVVDLESMERTEVVSENDDCWGDLCATQQRSVVEYSEAADRRVLMYSLLCELSEHTEGFMRESVVSGAEKARWWSLCVQAAQEFIQSDAAAVRRVHSVESFEDSRRRALEFAESHAFMCVSEVHRYEHTLIKEKESFQTRAYIAEESAAGLRRQNESLRQQLEGFLKASEDEMAADMAMQYVSERAEASLKAPVVNTKSLFEACARRAELADEAAVNAARQRVRQEWEETERKRSEHLDKLAMLRGGSTGAGSKESAEMRRRRRRGLVFDLEAGRRTELSGQQL